MAGVTFSGDIERLKRLTHSMSKLAQGKMRARVNKQLSQEALALTLDCFKNSTDPYGIGWKKLKHRSGMPLLDTGRLRKSISTRATDKGFEMGTDVAYAAIHNYGGIIRKKQRAGLLRLKSDSYKMSNGQTKIGRSRFAKYRARVEAMNRKVDAGEMTNWQRFESMRRMGIRRTTFSAHEIVMPRRQFIPDVKGRGLPDKWREEFHATVKEAIAEILK